MFTHSQLVMSFWATALVSPFLQTTTIVDLGSQHNNILSAITQDEVLQEHLHYPTDCWSLDISRILLKDRKIYVLLANNLYTCVLQYYYDHILVEYFWQNKILKLIHYGHTWLFLCADIKSFCNSCVICMRSKLQYHKLYKLLKQLLIPKQP